jgi:hypothetical protein
MKDRAYFGAIVDEMNRGGREALLHHLLSCHASVISPLHDSYEPRPISG